MRSVRCGAVPAAPDGRGTCAVGPGQSSGAVAGHAGRRSVHVRPLRGGDRSVGSRRGARARSDAPPADLARTGAPRPARRCEGDLREDRPRGAPAHRAVSASRGRSRTRGRARRDRAQDRVAAHRAGGRRRPEDRREAGRPAGRGRAARRASPDRSGESRGHRGSAGSRADRARGHHRRRRAEGAEDPGPGRPGRGPPAGRLGRGAGHLGRWADRGSPSPRTAPRSERRTR